LREFIEDGSGFPEMEIVNILSFPLLTFPEIDNEVR
jgi:hypothetical protein